jgi:hypothetical protein
MAHLTIIVPEDQADALRRELRRAHARRAAALRHALDRYLESHERLDDVAGALVELRDLHVALAQIGWERTAVPGDVAVTAHPEVLADAAAAAGLRALARRIERGEGR